MEAILWSMLCGLLGTVLLLLLVGISATKQKQEGIHYTPSGRAWKHEEG